MLKKITTKDSKVCFGYTNLAKNGMFLPFFDYDIKSLDLVLSELKYLQKKYELSDIYIYSSTNGFNALSFDKLPFNILKELYNECLLMCQDYIELGLKRNFLTLRFGRDKKLIKIMTSKNNKYQKSLAHAIFINMCYGTEIDTSKNFDTSMSLRLKAYRSAKHGFLKVKEL